MHPWCHQPWVRKLEAVINRDKETETRNSNTLVKCRYNSRWVWACGDKTLFTSWVFMPPLFVPATKRKMVPEVGFLMCFFFFCIWADKSLWPEETRTRAAVVGFNSSKPLWREFQLIVCWQLDRRAQTVKRWLREHETFSLMDWPPESPDLNPIQNIFAKSFSPQ